jgi:hypothetical protein
MFQSQQLAQSGIAGHPLSEEVVDPYHLSNFSQAPVPQSYHAISATNNTLTSTMSTDDSFQSNKEFNFWDNNHLPIQTSLVPLPITEQELRDSSVANEVSTSQQFSTALSPHVSSVADQPQLRMALGNHIWIGDYFQSGQMQDVAGPSQHDSRRSVFYPQAPQPHASENLTLQEPLSPPSEHSFLASRHSPPCYITSALSSALQQTTRMPEELALGYPDELASLTFIPRQVVNSNSPYTGNDQSNGLSMSSSDDYFTAGLDSSVRLPLPIPNTMVTGCFVLSFADPDPSLSQSTAFTYKSGSQTQSDIPIAWNHLRSNTSEGLLPIASPSGLGSTGSLLSRTSNTGVSTPPGRLNETRWSTALAEANLHFSAQSHGAIELRNGSPIRACTRCRSLKKKACRIAESLKPQH